VTVSPGLGSSPNPHAFEAPNAAAIATTTRHKVDLVDFPVIFGYFSAPWTT
jgi:hypothetical protein